MFLTWSRTPATLKTFTDDKLVGKIPAIATGHAYAEEDKRVGLAVTNPTPLSIPFIVEKFLPEVAEAVAGLVTDSSRRRPATGVAAAAPRRLRHAAITVAILVAAVVGVSALSVLRGRRRTIPLAALLDPDHPLHGVAAARVDRTLLGLAVGAALGLAGAVHAGPDPQPAGRPRHPRHQRRARRFAMVLAISVFGVSDLSGYVWFAFAGAAVAMVLVHASPPWARRRDPGQGGDRRRRADRCASAAGPRACC